jgi:homopolymeric O-antigen transport system ATP-binding protein
MRAPIVSARDVCKQYRLGAPQRRTNNIREALVQSVQNRFRRDKQRAANELFWALSNVSFDLEQGEVLGVIGRNGAGKSTLLKVLSRITEPTLGRIELRGRIASLLEVGTGFHPELTGRENTYLNGTILGMRKREIDRKFDEIVAFAEVEQFVDTPLKRYSSGMYVRLAFAVAAHLEPEILVIDEVLAVGDAEFQKKCLGKMGDVAAQGRTVLFVSHNLASVRAICTKALLLSKGQAVAFGDVAEVTSQYQREHASTSVTEMTWPIKSDVPQFTRLQLDTTTLEYNGTLEISGEIYSATDQATGIELMIQDERSTSIAYTSTSPLKGELVEFDAGVARQFRVKVGPLPLATGRYDVFVWLCRPWVAMYHWVPTPLTFEVLHSDPYGVGFEFLQAHGRGAFALPIEWEAS